MRVGINVTAYYALYNFLLCMVSMLVTIVRLPQHCSSFFTNYLGLKKLGYDESLSMVGSSC